MNLSIGSRMPLPACCAVVAVLTALLAVGCADRRSDQYRQEGDMYLRLGNFPQAEEAYRSAVQANPKNAQARLGLGQCLAAAGKVEESLVSFQETTRIAPENGLAYLKAANLLLILKNVSEATTTAQSLEKTNPEQGGVLHASVLLRSGQQDQAMTLLEALRNRFPDSELVGTHFAYSLLVAGEPEKAETALRTFLNKKPEFSVGANMLMVTALAAQNRIAEITSQREVVETQDPDRAMVLAHALIQTNRLEEGKTLVRAALERDPSSGWANFTLGAYLLDTGQRENAAKYLQRAADTLPWDAVVMYKSAVLPGPVVASSPHPGAGDTQAQVSERQASLSAPAQDWQTLWRQAALGRLVEERQRFASDKSDNVKETLVLALLFHGNNAFAEELAGELPVDSPLKAYLMALQDGDPEKAVNALAPWNEKEGALQILAMNATAFTMALANARNQAVQILSVCTERYPDNGVSLFNLAQVFRAANMPRFAAQALRRLTAMFPENIEAHISLVQTLREAGMQQDARQAAEVMYALFPDSRESTLATCNTYVDSSQLGRARKILEVYLQSHPGDPAVQLTQASVLFCEGHADEALRVLGEMKPPADFAPGVTTLTALCHAVTDDWQGVIDLAGANDPKSTSLAARFIFAAAHVKMGQQDKAAEVLTQPDKEEPFGGRPGVIILHVLGHSTGSLTDDEVALSNALASTPNALVDFISGVAYREAKLQDDAYLAFKRVDAATAGESDFLLDLLFRSLPNAARVKDMKLESLALAEEHSTSPRAWLGCAAVLQKLGDVEGERAALDKAAETGPNDPRVFLRRGDFFERQKDIGAAIMEYRHHLQIRPDDPVGNNNLAYNLSLADEDLPQALKSAQLAADALPQDPRVLHTLGVVQLRSGDLEQSKVSLTSALQRMPGEPSLLFDYGKLLIALGETEDGQRHIESALNTTRVLGVDFPRKSEAEEILAKISAAKPVPEPSPEEKAPGSV